MEKHEAEIHPIDIETEITEIFRPSISNGRANNRSKTVAQSHSKVLEQLEVCMVMLSPWPFSFVGLKKPAILHLRGN
jgi:hypothetical protein